MWKKAVLSLALGLAAAGAVQAQAVGASIDVRASRLSHMTPVSQAPAVQVRATYMQPVRHGYERPRHARHAIRVGEHLSPRELARSVRVDWRRAGLRAPQRGQQWLALDGRRVLVATRSSRVLRVI